MSGNIQNFYLRRAMGNSPVQITRGESGYFSAPEDHLDPNLFDGDRLKGEIRTHLVNALFAFMATRWARPQTWLTAWLAGSGISYQWAAGRGNGDLDVLLGVDWPALRRANPRYLDLSNAEIATDINNQLRNELWPRTALTRFGSGVYEVTYFLNANSTDIRTIHPYAAYNLITGTWTVRPPKLPKNPENRYPTEWKSAILTESKTAGQIIDRYNSAFATAQTAAPGGGAWTNAMAIASLAADQAAALYDSIHLGRREAFGEFGSGYGDYHNYRWQSHKRNGVASALHQIVSTRDQAGAAAQRAIYGHTLTDPEQSRIRALLWASQEHP